MNKDLSKEYKEAVMNDLPDLWGRIEAAIDAEESAKTDGNETPASNVINFSEAKKSADNNTVNTANKYAVNAYDNEPVKGQTTKKKKFRIPGWVFVAVPSAAILLLVIIPVGLLMIMGGLGSKSAAPTTTANFAFDAASSTTTVTSEPSPVYEDAAATCDEAFYDDSDDRNYKENLDLNKDASAVYNFTGGKSEEIYDILSGLQNLNRPDSTAAPTETNNDNTNEAASEAENPAYIVNSNVSVRFISVYEDEDGNRLADIYVEEMADENLYTSDDFEGLKAGDEITAYYVVGEDIEDEDIHSVCVYILPENDIPFAIELLSDNVD